jgi:hypothetical protein
MMKSLVVTIVVLSLIVVGLLLSCEDDPDIVKPEPGPPPEPPPDPPPPPQGSGISRYSLNSTPVMIPELIARNVLSGEYGPELQRLLADEITVCINQMSREGVVSVVPGESRLTIDVMEGSKGQVLFHPGYIVPAILDGRYGEDVRDALAYLLSGKGL